MLNQIVWRDSVVVVLTLERRAHTWWHKTIRRALEGTSAPHVLELANAVFTVLLRSAAAFHTSVCLRALV